jgi:hypothetical protein
MIKKNKNLFSKMQSIIRKGMAEMLCMTLLLLLAATGCKKISPFDETKGSTSEYSNVYYVVGYDGNSEINMENKTAKSGGYLFISEDLKDTLLANNRILIDDKYIMGNLLDDLFAFPAEIMPPTNCGFTFFCGEESRFAYKVQMRYRPMIEEEKQDVPRLVNAYCYNPYNNCEFNCIVITSISNIE